MPTSDDGTPPSLPTPRVATFFALYPDPLGLEDGAYFCGAEDSPLRGFPEKVALHLKEGQSPAYLDPKLHEYLFVSVRFHQGRRQNFIREHITQLSEVVSRVGGEYFNFHPVEASQAPDNDESSEDAGLESIYTVVEMTTPLAYPRDGYWEPCLPDTDIMGPTLTRCLEAVVRVVTSYRFAEKILIPNPARERIGPLIISATRPANPDDGGWDEDIRDVINIFATHRQPLARGSHQPTTMAAMARYTFLEGIGHPSLALGSLQNEMDVALYHDGNFRSAVMLSHSSSEVLLDVALMGMLFEEGQDAQAAARFFDKPLKSRILADYSERLGGVWSSKGSGATAVWMKDLLALRHRVAHTGYMPSSDEANAAREAHFSLGRHLRDRLTAKVKIYPFTAGILVTQNGFDRRNIQTKATAAAVNAATMENLASFLAWRNRVAQLRTGSS